MKAHAAILEPSTTSAYPSDNPQTVYNTTVNRCALRGDNEFGRTESLTTTLQTSFPRLLSTLPPQPHKQMC